MKNKGAIIGMIVIVAALVFSGSAFQANLVNYLPFAQARAAKGETVQVMGAPEPGTMNYADGTLRFTLREEKTGELMAATYKGPKPEDMDTASQAGSKIGAEGAYDPATQTFIADKLMIKCPSKYKGGGATQRNYGGA